MNNEERDRRLYKYPDSDVLRNKLDIRDGAALERAERLLVQQRMEESLPRGNFDLRHLQAIHRHLFQDIYEWAGQIREVDFHKGGIAFLPQGRIETGMNYLHSQIVDANYLKGLDRKAFAEKAAEILGNINFAHPFRDGNGRTQLLLLKQLSKDAGHKIELTQLDGKEWIEASIAANRADYTRMSACIYQCLAPAREKSKDAAILKAAQQERDRDLGRNRDRSDDELER